MFTVKTDLFDFDTFVGFWSGAKDRWEELSDDEKEYLNEIASEYEFRSLTDVNDFVWFDSDELINEYREYHGNNEDDED